VNLSKHQDFKTMVEQEAHTAIQHRDPIENPENSNIFHHYK
jgi:hypothetical protein